MVASVSVLSGQFLAHISTEAGVAVLSRLSMGWTAFRAMTQEAASHFHESASMAGKRQCKKRHARQHCIRGRASRASVIVLRSRQSLRGSRMPSKIEANFQASKLASTKTRLLMHYDRLHGTWVSASLSERQSQGSSAVTILSLIPGRKLHVNFEHINSFENTLPFGTTSRCCLWGQPDPHHAPCFVHMQGR